jgi:hypothetical protein
MPASIWGATRGIADHAVSPRFVTPLLCTETVLTGQK